MTDQERIYQTFLFCEGGWRSSKWIMAVSLEPRMGPLVIEWRPTR